MFLNCNISKIKVKLSYGWTNGSTEDPVWIPKEVFRIPTKPHTDNITAKAIIPQIMNCLPCWRFASSSELMMKNFTAPQINTATAMAKIKGIIESWIMQITNPTTVWKLVPGVQIPPVEAAVVVVTKEGALIPWPPKPKVVTTIFIRPASPTITANPIRP